MCLSTRVLRCLCPLVLSGLIFALPGALAAQNSWAGKTAYIPKLEKNLRENIAAFWLSKSLDRQNGGYIINFGPQGEPNGPGTKMIVTQARKQRSCSQEAGSLHGQIRA